MPTYTYEPREGAAGCDYCRDGFELVQAIGAPVPPEGCPRCAAPLRKVPPRIAVGRSGSGLDDRAKSAGFHKLKRLGKGEYERQY